MTLSLENELFKDNDPLVRDRRYFNSSLTFCYFFLSEPSLNSDYTSSTKWSSLSFSLNTGFQPGFGWLDLY